MQPLLPTHPFLGSLESRGPWQAGQDLGSWDWLLTLRARSATEPATNRHRPLWIGQPGVS